MSTMTQVPGAGADTTAPAPGARRLWAGLRERPGVLAALTVFALLVLVAIAAPLLAGWEGQDPFTYHPSLVDSASGGVPLGPFGGISGRHWLGVEPQTGRDLFARLVYGARISLGVAFAATVLQVVLGVGVGLLAALGGRLIDETVSRVTDVLAALPLLVTVLGLLAVVPAGFPRPVLIILVVGVVGWFGTSKITRAQALTLKTLDHVAAARLSGWGGWAVARREMLPALAAPVLTYAALLFPGNISVEAALSFLGVGIEPPTPSWGQMLSDADVWYSSAPTYLLLPAGALFTTVLCLAVVAEGVRTALDPRTATRLRVGLRDRGRRRAAGPSGTAAPPLAAAAAAPGRPARSEEEER